MNVPPSRSCEKLFSPWGNIIMLWSPTSIVKGFRNDLVLGVPDEINKGHCLSSRWSGGGGGGGLESPEIFHFMVPEKR